MIARQRLERRTDNPVGVEIMRPCRATAEGEDTILHRERFIAAQAEFGARGRDTLCAVGERKGVGAADRLLGIGRQIEGGELSRGVGRDADRQSGRDKTITAFDAPGPCIGVEPGAQLIGAGDSDGAIGGDVLPAVSQRPGDIGRADAVAHEGASLEQVGSSASQAIGN
jgi:hypothetical protein